MKKKQNNQKEELSELTERLRICANMAGSGDELSRKSAIPRRTLESYLTGESEPKITRVVEIAKAAGVGIEWLATGKGSPDLGFSDSGHQSSDGFIGQPVKLQSGHASETVEMASAALYAWLEKKKKVMKPDDFGKAVAVLCDMIPEDGKIDMKFIDRLMSFKGLI